MHPATSYIIDHQHITKVIMKTYNFSMILTILLCIGYTARMHTAVYNQNPDVITAPLNAGADIHAQTEYGSTP